MKKILGVSVLLLFACTPQEIKKADTPNYFDVAGYFDREAIRLQQANPVILKSVFANSTEEQASTKINDWKTELFSFSSSDINKASWKGEFKEIVTDNQISYSTNNPKIPIKRIEIIKNNQQIKGIKIFKSTKNYLYNSSDSLVYYADSIYTVKNIQDITLLGEKKYRVIARFNSLISN